MKSIQDYEYWNGVRDNLRRMSGEVTRENSSGKAQEIVEICKEAVNAIRTARAEFEAQHGPVPEFHPMCATISSGVLLRLTSYVAEDKLEAFVAEASPAVFALVRVVYLLGYLTGYQARVDNPTR